MNARGIAAIAAGLFTVVFGFMVLFGSWYTVDEGERGVLLTNGAITEVVEPGLHFKLPVFQKVRHITLRQQVVYWTCPTEADECDYEARRVMQAYSKDQQAADMRVTVNYRVDPSEVANVYATYGGVDELAQRVVARKVPQELKVIFGKFDAVSVIQSRDKFNAEATAAIARAIDTGPVIIDSVQVEDISFSEQFEKAVEDRMKAQVEVQQRQQELAKEEVNAKIAVTQAQGRADSVKAEADAKAYATKIQGEATADAIKARADALAANAALVELTKAERWDGKLPATMLPNSAVPFVNIQ